MINNEKSAHRLRKIIPKTTITIKKNMGHVVLGVVILHFIVAMARAITTIIIGKNPLTHLAHNVFPFLEVTSLDKKIIFLYNH